MLLTELLFIALATVLFVALLVLVGGYTTADQEVSTGMTMVFFFFILFPLTWAASAWTTPYGPVWMGVYWAPIIVLGLLFTLFIAALSPRRHLTKEQKKIAEQEAQDAAKATFGLFGGFFFLFVIVAAGVAIASYF